jgi:multiple sugar transport system ATP-binding protein
LTLGQSGIDAEVEVVEPTGSEVQIIARAANGDEVVAVFRERRMFEPGEKIRLSPVSGTVHLFDRSTGVRIQ